MKILMDAVRCRSTAGDSLAESCAVAEPGGFFRENGRPKPPRLICFSARTEAGRHASYQLAVHRNGKKAHVDAPGISADFTHRELAGFLTDTVTSWAGARRSLAARAASAVSSEPRPEGP